MRMPKMMSMISSLKTGRKSTRQMTGIGPLSCARLSTLTFTSLAVPAMHDQSCLFCRNESSEHDRACLHGRQLLWAMVQL